MNFSIVKYDESLAEQIVLMWRQSQKLATGKENIHSFDSQTEFLKNVLSKKYSIRLAIDSTGKVLGMIAYTNDTISQLYVDIDKLNLGIGTALLEYAKEYSNGKLELFTFQRNKIGKRFYEKNGFVEVGRNYPNEENLPDIKYRWTTQ